MQVFWAGSTTPVWAKGTTLGHFAKAHKTGALGVRVSKVVYLVQDQHIPVPGQEEPVEAQTGR
jgi:hypothetical protein